MTAAVGDSASVGRSVDAIRRHFKLVRSLARSLLCPCHSVVCHVYVAFRPRFISLRRLVEVKMTPYIDFRF